MRRCPHCGYEDNPSWAQICESCRKRMYESPDASLQADDVSPKDEEKAEEEPPASTISYHQVTQSEEVEPFRDEVPSPFPTEPEIDDQVTSSAFGEHQPSPLPDSSSPEHLAGAGLEFLFPPHDEVTQREWESPPPSPSQTPEFLRPSRSARLPAERQTAQISRVARTPPPGALLVGSVVSAGSEQRRYPPDWSKTLFLISLGVAASPLCMLLGIVGIWVSCIGSALIALVGATVSLWLARRQAPLPVLQLQVRGNRGQLVSVFVIEPAAGSHIGPGFEVAAYGQWQGQQIRAHRIEILAAPDPTAGELRSAGGEIEGRQPFPAATAGVMTIIAIAVWIAIISFVSDIFS